MHDLVNFDNRIWNSPDEGAGSPPEEETPTEEKKVTFTPEQQAEIDRLVGHTRTKEREKAKAAFEAEKLKAKDDADKAAMQEQGKYRELAETAEKEKLVAVEKADKAALEARELKLQIAFEDAAEELDIAFVSKQAARDAFKFLDLEKAGEDGANMKKALEALQGERPYLFAENEEVQTTDARQKGARPAKEVLDKEKEAELKSRFRIRKPR